MYKKIFIITSIISACFLINIQNSFPEIKKISKEGEIEFKKEGYSKENGVRVRQHDACYFITVKTDNLKADFDLRMAKECWNEKEFANTPCIIASPNITNEKPNEIYFAYNVSFFDENMKLIAVASESDVLDPGPGMSNQRTMGYVNLPLTEISKVRYYKIIFYESDEKISMREISQNE